jgi:hypothetical protein
VSIRIRIWTKETEVDDAVAALRRAFVVTSVSAPYRDRRQPAIGKDAPRLVRVYVDADRPRFTDDDREARP